MPTHAQARPCEQQAALQGLVADAVAEAHEVPAVASHIPTGSMGTFIREAATRPHRALNQAGAATMLLAMLRVMNAVHPWLKDPEAAPYVIQRKWDPSHWAGRPLSMGVALRLTGKGSSAPLDSSLPALLHALALGRTIRATRLRK